MMAQRTSTRYTPETYKGMTTVAGIVVFLFFMCNRLTISFRIAGQVFFGILWLATIVACGRIRYAIRENRDLPTYTKAALFLLKGIAFTAIIAVATIVHLIPVVPVFSRALVSGFGVVIWLRLKNWIPASAKEKE